MATVISRYVEASIVIIWTHRHTRRNPFIAGAYRSFYIPAGLVKSIVVKLSLIHI